MKIALYSSSGVGLSEDGTTVWAVALSHGQAAQDTDGEKQYGTTHTQHTEVILQNSHLEQGYTELVKAKGILKMIHVLGHDSALRPSWAHEMYFGMNCEPCAGSIAQPVDQHYALLLQSTVITLCLLASKAESHYLFLCYLRS